MINDQPNEQSNISLLNLVRAQRPAVDASFALLDGRPVLFCEQAQKIYELNQIAAFIWCGLLDKKSIEAICDGMEKSGLNRVEARNYVRKALRDWFSLGLLEADWELPPQHAFAVNIGKLTVRIQTSGEHLSRLLRPLFHQANRAPTDARDTFEVIEVDGYVYIFHNKTRILRCAINEFVPAFKAYLAEQIVARCSPDVAFHTACLLSGRRALLVSGAPGAGKTTLAMNLVEAGFEYCADDTVLIAPDGRVSGVAFAPTLKSGAWPMIEKLNPNLRTCPVHIRPDGNHVRYLEMLRTNHDGGLPVGWIVFIKRAPDVAAKLTPLGQLETIGRLIDGSYAPDGKLNSQTFHAVKQTLATAECFELTYSDAAQAKDKLADLCNGRL